MALTRVKGPVSHELGRGFSFLRGTSRSYRQKPRSDPIVIGEGAAALVMVHAHDGDEAMLEAASGLIND